MARRRRIDARCDDGGGLLDERAGLEGDTEERSDVSPAQGFTRGDGAGQHHRALSTLGIFVPMGVGGFSARVLRGAVVVCHRGFGRPLIIDPPVAHRIAATWDQERARKARRVKRRGLRQDAWDGRIGTSVAAHSNADPCSWSSCYWKATSGLSVSMRRRLPRYETS